MHPAGGIITDAGRDRLVRVEIVEGLVPAILNRERIFDLRELPINLEPLVYPPEVANRPRNEGIFHHSPILIFLPKRYIDPANSQVQRVRLVANFDKIFEIGIEFAEVKIFIARLPGDEIEPYKKIGVFPDWGLQVNFGLIDPKFGIGKLSRGPGAKKMRGPPHR